MGKAFLFHDPCLDEKNNNSFITFRQTSLNEINRIPGSIADGMKSCVELPAKFFQDNFAILGNVILDICNCSLSYGTFPDALMIAMVTCLYKANSSLLCENYRSMSLLIVIGKIIEKLVYVRSQEYLRNKLIIIL